MIRHSAIKPFTILSLFIVIACAFFWLSSRYPDLSGKAILSDSPILSQLGFFPIFEIRESDPLWKKTLFETGNWINTNKKGMTFSFIIGALLLSLWPLFKQRQFNSGIKNSLLGMAIGAPMGVCVNCAAPIARAMHGAGSAIQTSLSTLVASPTLNIVVLTMALSLFPLHIVAAKVLATLLLIQVIIPLACHYFFQREIKEQQRHIRCDVQLKESLNQQPTSWLQAFIWSVKTFFSNLIYLLKIALPLMLLAGFLGSLVTTLLPWASLDSFHQNQPVIIVATTLIVIALVGTILPAPMAFDVILASVLLQAGLPVHYVTTLLFTLGTFSIYAFFIVWQGMSLRIGLFLLFSTLFLGILAGVSTGFIEKKSINQSQDYLFSDLPKHDHDRIAKRTDNAASITELKPELEKNQLAFEKVDITSLPHLTITARNYQKNQVIGSTPFTLINENDLGLNQPYEISYMTGIVEALAYTTTSIASGDVHNDGWPDILLTGDLETQPNLILYANIGGKLFKRQEIKLPDSITEVTLVALVDLNGDQWLDIVFATMSGASFVIFNQKGNFYHDERRELHSNDAATIMSMAFGDVEGDGDLDIFLGNWNVGPRHANFSHSQNKLLIQQNTDRYIVQALDGTTGETLTSLFYDFDNDQLLDLYIGNDFSLDNYSDLILQGSKNGQLFMEEKQSFNHIPGSHSTMSIDIGDIDNDLRPDLYIGQIAFMGHYEDEMHELTDKQIPYHQYCKKIHDLSPRQCQREMQLKYALASATHISDACNGLDNDSDKTKCLIHLVAYKAYCRFNSLAQLPSKQITQQVIRISSERYRTFCDKFTLAEQEERENPDKMWPNPELHLLADNPSLYNTLLHNQSISEKVFFNESAIERQAAFGGWTWNARFGDLDNDSWQDLYLVNGHSFQMALTTNIFYQNQGQGYFDDKTRDFGLENHTITTAFSLVDFDNDGDLDSINIPLDAPIQTYQNNNLTNYHSIQFELRDSTQKNTYAIGAELTIHYGENQKQWGQLKGSGGSKSYNQPMIHFGLANIEQVDNIQIHWPDGSKDNLDGPFTTNKRYRIHRQ